MMKPSEQCKAAGLKNLLELSQITGKPVQTLIRWHDHDPVFFEILLRGAVDKKHCKAMDDLFEDLPECFKKQSGSE